MLSEKKAVAAMAELKILNMDEIPATEVEWLWYPYIPYGKITIVHGDPGDGKTMMILQLASILSRGDSCPVTIRSVSR